MTNRELIRQLKTLPADALVMVDGYEGGVQELTRVAFLDVFLDVNCPNWTGPHEAPEDPDMCQHYAEGYPNARVIKAILLPRKAKP